MKIKEDRRRRRRRESGDEIRKKRYGNRRRNIGEISPIFVQLTLLACNQLFLSRTLAHT